MQTYRGVSSAVNLINESVSLPVVNRQAIEGWSSGKCCTLINYQLP